MLQGRARDMLVGSALLLLPLVALNLWTTTLAFERDGATTLRAFGGDDVGTGIEDVAAVLVVLFASLAAAIVGFLVTTMAIADRFGGRVTLPSALRATARRLPTVVTAWAIGHVWLPFLATWSLSAPADGLAVRLVVVLPVASILVPVTLLVVPVMVAEHAGVGRSLKRAWRLTRLRFGAVYGFVAASTLIASLLVAGITSLPALLEVGGFVTFGGYTWLAQGLAAQLAMIIVVPLIALATAELYLTIRLDAEGMDIAIDADRAFGRTGSRA